MQRFLLTLLTFLFVATGCRSQATADFDLRAATATDIQEHLRSRDGRVRVVNFWATWCVPCRVEFPDFVRLAREYGAQGVDVVFVSMDFYPDDALEAEVRAFLAEQGVQGVTFIKNELDDPFIEAFVPEWGGGLPATIVYGPTGNKAAFWEGATTFEHLREVVVTVLESHEL